MSRTRKRQRVIRTMPNGKEVRGYNMEKLYRLDSVADQANLKLRTVQSHVAQGKLTVVRVGPYKRPRVQESELRKYLGSVRANRDRMADE
jgi:hypothetical protein